jgi:hypothetical protein
LRELDKKLEELTKSSPSGQTSTKIKPKLDAALESLKDSDPVLADVIAKAISEATNSVDEEFHAREVANLNFLRQQESSSYQEVEATRLLEMFPNAREVFTSPHWAEWKNGQSDAVLGLAGSTNADDVAKAFKLYAEDMLAQYPDLSKAENTEVKQPNAEAEAKAKKIEEERARKKSTAANVGTANAAGKQSLPDDPEVLFKRYSEQLRKERLG